MKKLSKLFVVVILFTMVSCSKNITYDNPGHVGMLKNDTVYMNTEHYLYDYYVDTIWKNYSDTIVFIPMNRNKVSAMVFGQYSFDKLTK